MQAIHGSPPLWGVGSVWQDSEGPVELPESHGSPEASLGADPHQTPELTCKATHFSPGANFFIANFLPSYQAGGEVHNYFE